jgi:cell division septal protein FtsQ
MSEYNTASVKTVSDAIKLKRKKRRKSTFRKWFVRFLLVAIILSISYGIYKLDQSNIFRVKAIRVSNNHVLSQEQIIDAFDISINDRVWLIHDFMLNDKIQDYKSIESYELTKKNNVVLINVNEFDVVGYKNDTLLLANGAYIDITEFNQHYLLKVPEIHGFDDEELSTRLAESLGLLTPEIRMIISSVQQKETTYDQAQIWMVLFDQKQVFSDFRSVELLNNYHLFVDQIAPGNNCIYLDYTSSSARSSVCE